jgi:hypothetical protein
MPNMANIPILPTPLLQHEHHANSRSAAARKSEDEHEVEEAAPTSTNVRSMILRSMVVCLE